jgi:acyl carrier protein
VNATEARKVVVDLLDGIAPGQDLESVPGDAPLTETLDLDSLDFLNFVVGLDERVGLHTPESDYPRLGTLDAAVEYVVTGTASSS